MNRLLSTSLVLLGALFLIALAQRPVSSQEASSVAVLSEAPRHELLARYPRPAAPRTQHNVWSIRTTTTTRTDGVYSFMNMPALGAGQAYAATYVNEALIPGRLFLYVSRELTSYSGGSHIYLGQGEIADIPLSSPPSGAVVNLPETFNWSRRGSAPSDSYALTLHDPNDFDPAAQTVPLGYLSSVTIGSLPPEFVMGIPYVWEVWTFDPQGGIGISLYYHEITFAGAGPSPTPRSLFGRG